MKPIEPNKFYAIDFKARLPVGTQESGKIKRLTVDYERQALQGFPVEPNAESSDIYMRKVAFRRGGFGRMFVGLKIARTDEEHPKFDINNLHPVAIKELTLTGAASRLRPPVDENGQVLDNAVTGKVHASSREDALREPMMMRAFNAPQGPSDVLVNKKESKIYIVQEMLAGDMTQIDTQLRQLTPRTRLLFLMHTLVQQLVVIHKAGCIHRDIKPLNVLIDHSGQRLVLADYGGVKEGKRFEVGGGSPSHRAPEQCDVGPGKYIDQKADVFSLGVLLMDAINSKGLFSRRQAREDDESSQSSARNRAHYHQNDFCRYWSEPDSLREQDPAAFEHFEARLTEFRDNIPEELFNVVLGMLHPNREQRLPIWLAANAPERTSGVRSVEEIIANTDDAASVAESRSMWDNVNPFAPEVVTPLRDLVREVKTISERRDHPHCYSYFEAIRDKDVKAALAALHSQTPFEREMGPRIEVKPWVGTLSEQVAAGTLRPLGWQAWYAQQARDEPGHLLRVALMNKNERAAQLLLGCGNLGLNANGPSMNAALTALHNNFKDIARVLLLQGSALEAEMLTKCLGVAVSNDHDELVPLLLEMGADPTGRNRQGRDLLYMAAKRGKLPLAAFLINYGAELVSETPDSRWVPSEYATHPLLTDTLRSYAVVLPVIFNQPAIAQFMLRSMNLDQNSTSILPLLYEFAVSLSSRDRQDRSGLLNVLAQSAGRPLPDRLSDQARAALQALVPTGPAAKVVQRNKPQDTRLARLQSSIIACKAPMPTLLDDMSDEQRTIFGRARTALFTGQFAEAHGLFSQLTAFPDAVLQCAHASIGMKNYATAAAELDSLTTKLEEVPALGQKNPYLATQVLTASSWVQALEGQFEKAIEQCTALLASNTADRAAALKLRAWCYASIAARINAQQPPEAQAIKKEYQDAALEDFRVLVNVPLKQMRIHHDAPAYMPQGATKPVFMQLYS